MMGGQLVAIPLAAVIFFLQGGDCRSMFIKDKPAQDCCRKDHCSHTNPDPCCQISAKADIAKEQAKQKTALPELAAMPVVAGWVQPVTASIVDWAHRTVFASSPPGERGNFSLPLLV
ncbi:MAG: hypothetical protein FJW40_25990 [Acidobacteria bacterium]|nr:hypothetical protein [Acidobacteriota bacterium]